ncbi:WXG100 family type VII secretion target [Mycobacterium sp. TNTM28]|uniref:WXG100 family type VII secretion target n=1 Tax=[Mycobacterium] fortunisiensis TaxID=2600579 RepID=A0ABS6KUU3_9MYCO|nr:WXG100 family type VII secretion target [[Mycobacterium] fortunisiensis]MBU9767046.1 WXG100 family type VII secretion target [[Mycobacterium] fortunisiensis]
MGNSVEVVTSELLVASDRLRSAGQRLQDGLSAVDLETSNLLGSGWKGEAATAFGSAWDQWHKGAGQVVRSLQAMSDLLSVAGKEYAKTDEQAGGALDSTMQTTGGGGGSASGGGSSSGGGAAAPSASGGSSGTAGQAGAAGGSTAPQQSLSDQMNLGQVMQPLSQLGQIPAQMAGGLAQAAQVASGVVQQAVQAGSELAQQGDAPTEAEDAEDADAGVEDTGAPEGAEGGDGATAPVQPRTEGPAAAGPQASPGRSL